MTDETNASDEPNEGDKSEHAADGSDAQYGGTEDAEPTTMVDEEGEDEDGGSREDDADDVD
ncbi:hypothetical protein [Natrialba asiatica]|uniref:Uncharacterized protein n=1 Tax=Natrialba asiatica (strain ATCC 700177 / DSM 12278 / JCM 9576 / FERM P-10747 / NBRC 102637 / 172P1) TaxID=29540 RepID=M0B588_NATA1|nr:hypothetical protein [Natrialba asiatica]ELZ04824.1 hypothetical protein C481_03557 [Natrialba asiatica DSM 12278]